MRFTVMKMYVFAGNHNILLFAYVLERQKHVHSEFAKEVIGAGYLREMRGITNRLRSWSQ